MNWLSARTIAAIVGSALAVAIATYLVQHGQVNRLRAENQTLVGKQEQIAGERDAASAAANATREELDRLRGSQTELLRLRAEVGSLRKQTNELASLLEETRRLRSATPTGQGKDAAKTPPEVPRQDIFPKESWKFVGYATPEAAIQTFNWALMNGDLDTIAACYASSEFGAKVRQNLADEFRGKSRSENLAEPSERGRDITGYRIFRRGYSSDTNAVFAIHVDGPNHYMSVKLERVGSEWKLAEQN